MVPPDGKLSFVDEDEEECPLEVPEEEMCEPAWLEQLD